MRNAIREYIDLTKAEKEALWESATFVFDTNVFLNLYRYSKKTREILLGAMKDLGDRLWMPNQVAHEFMRNRQEIIHETSHRYDSLGENFFSQCMGTLRLKEDDPDFKRLKKYVSDWISQHKKQNVAVTSESDPILEEILSLFDRKVGAAFDNSRLESIKKEGAARYAKSIPPGYKDARKSKGDDDNNAYGDLIVWMQILEYAKANQKDIIFVTHDRKEDWWQISHGRTLGPRVELKREFAEETKRQFHMYTMETFIANLDSGSNDDAVKEVESYSKRLEYYHNILDSTKVKSEPESYDHLLSDHLFSSARDDQTVVTDFGKYLIAGRKWATPKKQNYEIIPVADPENGKIIYTVVYPPSAQDKTEDEKDDT